MLSSPAWAHAAPTPVERARELRSALQEILKNPTPAAYASYFELLPSSVAEFQQLFSERDSSHRTILVQGMGSLAPYLLHACKTYEVVGPERYTEKFVGIAADAGSWGGPPNRDNEDLLNAGHLFQNLLFRHDCAQPSLPAQMRELVTAASRLDDARLEKLYVSLGWDGMEGAGMEWFPIQWLLDGICKRQPQRCALTRQLTAKYKSLIEDDTESL